MRDFIECWHHFLIYDFPIAQTRSTALKQGEYWGKKKISSVEEGEKQKQIKEVEQVSSSAPVEFLGENALETKSVTLFEDRIVLIKPAVVKNDQSIASPCKEVIPEINALSIVGSPPENIRSRVLYAMENKPQKGSMTYFLPKRTLVTYLNLCDASKKRGLKRSLTTQTS